MKEPKTLAEWLESQGNPKHSIAEDDWGFWDAVVTIMKNCGMKELDAKAVR